MRRKVDDTTFFIGQKSLGTQFNNKKYELLLSSTITKEYIVQVVCGIQKAEIMLSGIDKLITSKALRTDKHVVSIPNHLFEENGYDVQKVAARFACFTLKSHKNNNLTYASECFQMSVLKDEEKKLSGDFQEGDWGDDMLIFAV
jgi:hypothetical protein